MTAARRVAALFAALVVASVLLAGCGGSTDPSKTLTVLAGSELKDLEPLLPDLERATGIRLVPSYIGTLEGAEKIAGGEATDAAWFSHGKYLSLLPGAGSRIVASEDHAQPGRPRRPQGRGRPLRLDGQPRRHLEGHRGEGRRRVVPVRDDQPRREQQRPDRADRGRIGAVGELGRPRRRPGRQGGAALVLQGPGDDRGQLRLARRGVRQEQDSVDGIINYESVLLSLNAGGELAEPLVLVYPKEGIVTADYPLMLLEKDKRAAWDAVVAWLRTPETQARIMKDTARRPAVPGVTPDARFPTRTLIELPYPAKLETIDALITAYLDEERKPASAVFVLDVRARWTASGSTASRRPCAHSRARTPRSRALRALPRPRGGHDHPLLRGHRRRAAVHDRRHRPRRAGHDGDPGVRGRPRHPHGHGDLHGASSARTRSWPSSKRRTPTGCTRSCS